MAAPLGSVRESRFPTTSEEKVVTSPAGSVAVAARRPRITPRAGEMRARLAGALGISPVQVNVKATTGEGMGFVGRGEGIAAHAVALLARVA